MLDVFNLIFKLLMHGFTSADGSLDLVDLVLEDAKLLLLALMGAVHLV